VIVPHSFSRKEVVVGTRRVKVVPHPNGDVWAQDRASGVGALFYAGYAPETAEAAAHLVAHRADMLDPYVPAARWREAA
jgi:hypothetical protein